MCRRGKKFELEDFLKNDDQGFTVALRQINPLCPKFSIF